MSDQARSAARRSGRRLEILTLVWNVIEAAVALGVAALTGSPALLGFGVDSLIESSSGAVLLWHLWGTDRPDREALALKLVGYCFLALAAFVAWESVGAIMGREAPEPTAVGIALAAVSLVVMPILARAKRRVATRLQSAALEADARQTEICAYLSAILLLGLGLNALAGWWWADPVAALAMVPIIGVEGKRALRGETCACTPASGEES